MNKKKVVQTIKESLDNLSVIKLSNKQKAEAIYDAIEELLEEKSSTLYISQSKGSDNDKR